MNKRIRIILTVILSALLLLSIVMTVRHQIFNHSSDLSNRRAAELAREAEPAAPRASAQIEAPVQWQPFRPDDDPYLAQLEKMDLAVLREVNPEVLGWISIPGTGIDYPLLQTEDNSHYLKYSWDGERNDFGAIFLDCTLPANLSAFHSIIYGHNMGRDKMFGPLREYADEDFFHEHPYVYILSDAGAYRYEIYSSYQTRVDTISYGIRFPTEAGMEKFISYSCEQSQFDSGIEPEITDRILSLSTCSGDLYDERWIVHARLPMLQK
ncbi:MAG: class B sortase [Oscillospiraceae bacterium]|nr:class B sortase [Oscillospiraceae bacterium]